MKILRCTYDGMLGRWIEGRGVVRYSRELQVVAGDVNLLQFEVINLPGLDLTPWINALFGYKTKANYEANGDWEQAFAGYLDDDWHDLTLNRGTVPFAIPLAKVGDGYRATLTLFDVDNNHFQFDDEPFVFDVHRPVYTQTESTVPATLPVGELDGIVLAGTDRVVIPATGMTTSGKAFAFFDGPPVSTIGASCGNGTVTVILGGPVDEDTPVIAIARRNS